MLSLTNQSGVIKLSGELSNQNVQTVYAEAVRAIRSGKVHNIDLTSLTDLDSAGVAFLDELQSIASENGSLLIINGADRKVADIIETFSSLSLELPSSIEREGFFERIGGKIIELIGKASTLLLLASETAYWSVVGIFDHRSARKGSFYQQASQLGVMALPIVALLSLIIGFILSLQSGVQLRNYGAGIFLADLLSITLVREMGPLLTAIIIAGRSGSAIASEIATMKVTEELDALKVMALYPLRYVIVPKIHAITVVMPIIVSFSILIGMMGGAVVALGYLDLSLTSFVNRAIDVIFLKDLVISFTKSIIFAWVIVIIGSFYGLQVKGGAEGVGRATTMSVVNSIFSVIVIDAIFSLLYL